MNLLARLTDTQRKLVMFGVPAVVGVFLVSRLAGGSSEPDAEPDPPDADLPVGAVGPYAMPSTDAIGTGTLSDFLSQLTDQYNSIQRALVDRPNGVTPIPPPARRTDGQVIAACDLAAMYRRRISVNDPRITQGCRRSYARYLLARGARPA